MDKVEITINGVSIPFNTEQEIERVMAYLNALLKWRRSEPVFSKIDAGSISTPRVVTRKTNGPRVNNHYGTRTIDYALRAMYELGEEILVDDLLAKVIELGWKSKSADGSQRNTFQANIRNACYRHLLTIRFDKVTLTQEGCEEAKRLVDTNTNPQEQAEV